MLNNQINLELADLRSEAEAKHLQQPAIAGQSSDIDLLRLQHELEVHQVELKIQNEQLQTAQIEIQEGLERYTDLFDFAPVGYLNLTEDGTIKLAYLSAAQLLDIECDQLLERSLELFVPDGERSACNQFMEQVFTNSTRQTCELSLLGKGTTTRTAKMIAVRSASTDQCRVVLMDITDRKLAEQKVHEQLKELLRWQNLMLAREGRVQHIKGEVNELLARLDLPARYPSQIRP